MAQGPKTLLTWKTCTETDDDMGGFAQTWTKVKDVSGTLSIISDRERQMYGKKAEGCDYKFTVDYVHAKRELNGVVTVLSSPDRLYLGNRIFDIKGIENPMNQNRFIMLFLSENVDG